MDIATTFADTEKSLHHFTLIEGEDEDTLHALLSALEKRDQEAVPSGRLLVFRHESVLTEDADYLKTLQQVRALDGGAQYVVVTAKSIHPTAQQKLLKVFEEPKGNMHFFLLIPRIEVVLPTVQSRAHIVRSIQRVKAEDISRARTFLDYSVTERLSFIATFLKGHDDDEDSGALRNDALRFLSGIQQIFREKKESTKDTEKIMRETTEMMRYLDTPGASVKMILEYIALLG